MHSYPQKPLSHRWTRRRVLLGGSALRVLVADDNRNAADALAAYLSFDRRECRVAFSGSEAIVIGTIWLPHVIVMDVSMPECNGFDAALALRHQIQTSNVAIVAFTASDEAEVRGYLTGDEFDGYCLKGQPPADLLDLLMMFVG